MIRKAEKKDLKTLMKLYDRARKLMREGGNLNQWINGYPSEEVILADIDKGNYYILTDESERIFGGFACIKGEDPTYGYIEGEWLDSRPYATIHRLVSSFERGGIAEECFNYCRDNISKNLRVDTHSDNLKMQEVVKNFGFKYCGIIYLKDGNPRLAYQLP